MIQEESYEKDLDQNELENVNEEISETEINEEIPEESEEEDSRKRTNKYDKKYVSKLQRDKYRALQEAANWRAEAEELRTTAANLKAFSDKSNEAAIAHYDSNIQLRIEKAKEKKRKALEEGDTESSLDADIELSRATAKEEELNSWKSQQYHQRKAEEDYYQQQNAVRQRENQNITQNFSEINEPTRNWLQKNTWWLPNSPDFDPGLVQEVTSYANALDMNLHRNGRTNEIMSPSYYNKIDNYIRQMDNDDYSNRGEFTVNNSRSNTVSPVRNEGRNINGRQRERVVVSADEKQMARSLGLTEEQYIKYKKQDQAKHKERLESRIRYYR